MQNDSECHSLTKLESNYIVWFLNLKSTKNKTDECFMSALKEEASFETVEEFWGIYQHMKKPLTIVKNSNFYIFKEGIKPMWADPQNQNGGRLIVCFKKEMKKNVNTAWEELLIEFLLLDQDRIKINGVSLDIKFNDINICLWMPPKTPEELEVAREWFKRVTAVTPEVKIDYKAHPQSLST